MTAPLDLIVVLRKLGACSESLAWLEERRAEDPGASFAKRWAEAPRDWRVWSCLNSYSVGPCVCTTTGIDGAEHAQRGLYDAFLRIATPAEVDAARVVRR